MDSQDHAQKKGPGTSNRADSIDDYNVFDDAKTYYSESRHKGTKASARTRTFSQNSLMQQMERLGLKEPFRRGSHGMSCCLLHAMVHLLTESNI